MSRKEFENIYKIIENMKISAKTLNKDNEATKEILKLIEDTENIITEDNNNHWIKCNDRLPKDSQDVDIYTTNNRRITDISYYENEGSKYFYDSEDDKVYIISDVSHWMVVKSPQEENL